MIKAETITHEGTPGPNWLDHCRSIMTPWTITAALVVIAVVGIVWVTQYHRQPNQPAAPSQAATTPAAANSLQVAPLQNMTETAAPSSASLVQAPIGATDSAPTTGAAQLGAPQTPTLNNTGNTGNGNNLVNQLQNTLTKSGPNLLDSLQTIWHPEQSHDSH